MFIDLILAEHISIEGFVEILATAYGDDCGNFVIIKKKTNTT